MYSDTNYCQTKGIFKLNLFVPFHKWILSSVVTLFTTCFPHTLYCCVCYDYCNTQPFCHIQHYLVGLIYGDKVLLTWGRTWIKKKNWSNFKSQRPKQSEVHWPVAWVAKKYVQQCKGFVLCKLIKYRHFVHSADCLVIQKDAWERLKGSLKMNGSVWVNAVNRDAFKFIRTFRYHERRIKILTCNC